MPFALRFVAVAAALTLAACASDTDPDVVEPTDPDELVETSSRPGETTVDKLNLNTASEAEFQALPDVGERMAHEFEEYRPYVSIQEFRREMAKYVDADAIEGYESYVFVPIDPNLSDAETLAQLPGVELDEAALLVEARPFENDVAFLAALEPLVTPAEQEAASAYLVGE